MRKLIFTFLFIAFSLSGFSQSTDKESITLDRIFQTRDFSGEYFGRFKWTKTGDAYTAVEKSTETEGGYDIVRYDAETGKRTIDVPAAKLLPEGAEKPLYPADYFWSEDNTKLMIMANTRRVWRYHTKGDFWVYDSKTEKLKRLGTDRPEASLQFAKFSPDGKFAAYVSEHNIYTENIDNQEVKALTIDGTDRIINGTFDWAYEEEFACRDGFRWSPDGKKIAFWKIDATNIRNFYMVNTTDSIYSQIIPVEYPKVGETPSACYLKVIDLQTGTTSDMKVPGDPSQHYIPRMKWFNDSDLIIQQLNRKQNTNKVMFCDTKTGRAETVYTEKDAAWTDASDDWLSIENGQSFLWISDKTGWSHIYKISRDGKKVSAVTSGEFDVISMIRLDEKGGYVYFSASPEDPLRRYLYRAKLNGKGKIERLSPEKTGDHSYDISPNAKFAVHTFSSLNTPSVTDMIALPAHKITKNLVKNEALKATVNALKINSPIFYTVKTAEGVNMETYEIRPPDFDENKKYPVLLYVYGEPAGQTARDRWGGRNFLWHNMLAQKGYVVITTDNRGTPSPKGREWRKSIYRKIGIINADDQAAAMKQLLADKKYLDSERVAVWGWSGGGSMTLNLMFRYADVFKTGMSVAPVSNQLYYDNIYQERYMGLPSENREDFVAGSPITHAKNLQGNLLLVHGTGDDNVHYQNSEALINELILNNKQFTMMAYPNRSHGIYEGKNTSRHLYTLLTDYLLKNCPPNK